jgi:hypothetical protein
MSVTEGRRQPRRRGAPPGARGHPRPPTDESADDPLLPPGRRDGDGFWIPDGCDDPQALFSPHQRRLQQKQRQAHRVRRGGAQGDDDDAGGAEQAGRPAGNGAPPRAPRVDSPRGSD